MRAALLLGLCSTACQVVFPRHGEDAPPGGITPITPIQQVTGDRPELDDGSTTFTINTSWSATTVGHALIAAVIVRSTDQGVEKIIDDGGGAPNWHRALDGNLFVGSDVPFRIEVWYAVPQQKVTHVDVYCTNDRPMATVIAELDVPTAMFTPLASKTRGNETSATAASGDIDLARPALIVATTGFSVASTAELTTAGLQELLPITAGDVHAATAIGTVADPGTFNAQWSLGDPTAQWNAGIVGISL